MKKIALSLIVGLMLSISILGQAKEITQEESHQNLVAAFQKEYEGAWRTTLKYDYFENGKPSAKYETVTESDNPDRLRQVQTNTSGGQVEKFELMRIGETYYCRKNNTAWKKSDDWCDENNKFVGGSGDEVSSKYTVEDTKLNNQNAKLFRQYIVNTDGNTETYWDYRFWINNEGFILRREIEQGLLKPKTITSEMTETREYNAKNIKIAAPIK